MEYAINFFGVASAIFVSFAVALGLECLSLAVIMRLMPARKGSQAAGPRMEAKSRSQQAGNTSNARDGRLLSGTEGARRLFS
jgi:hypothetical protein